MYLPLLTLQHHVPSLSTCIHRDSNRCAERKIRKVIVDDNFYVFGCGEKMCKLGNKYVMRLYLIWFGMDMGHRSQCGSHLPYMILTGWYTYIFCCFATKTPCLQCDQSNRINCCQALFDQCLYKSIGQCSIYSYIMLNVCIFVCVSVCLRELFVFVFVCNISVHILTHVIKLFTSFPIFCCTHDE